MDVIVLPEYQGRGIGKELMKHVTEYIDSLSRDGGVFVNLMSAQGREGFYERFGFERENDVIFIPGGEADKHKAILGKGEKVTLLLFEILEV